MAGCSKQFIRRIEIEAMKKFKESFDRQGIQYSEAFEILQDYYADPI